MQHAEINIMEKCDTYNTPPDETQHGEVHHTHYIYYILLNY